MLRSLLTASKQFFFLFSAFYCLSFLWLWLRISKLTTTSHLPSSHLRLQVRVGSLALDGERLLLLVWFLVFCFVFCFFVDVVFEFGFVLGEGWEGAILFFSFLFFFLFCKCGNPYFVTSFWGDWEVIKCQISVETNTNQINMLKHILLFLSTSSIFLFNIYLPFSPSLAGFLLAISCGIYPSGWGSNAVKQACGKDADFYEIGHCRLGWAFFIFVIGISLAFICSGLSLRAGKKSMSSDVEDSNSFM